RIFVVYVSFEEKQARRVFTGNDCRALLFSPDKTRMASAQVVPDGVDVYMVRLPAVEEMPVIDLAKAREEEANAGWFDHKRERMKPFMQIAKLDGAGNWTWSPDGGALVFEGRYPLSPDDAPAHDIFVCDLQKGVATNLSDSVDISHLEPRLLLG